MTKALTKTLLVMSLTAGTQFTQAETIELSPGANIQDAIDSAANGDIIRLLPGTYQPTSPLNTNGKAISIIGDLDVSGIPISIIDGQGTTRLFQFTNGEGPETVLENLKITNGNATDANDPLGDTGGGIYCESSPTIRNCTISSCESFRGGAIAILDDAYPLLTGCRLLFNSGFFGGAIFTPITPGVDPTTDLIIEGCTFSGNTTEYDIVNGIIRFAQLNKRLVLRSCQFTAHSADTCVFVGHDALIEDCTFQEAGTIAVEWGDGSLDIRDSEFAGTEVQAGVSVFAPSFGGPPLPVTVEELFVDNCSFRGFGLCAVNTIASQSTGIIQSSTFRDNRLGLPALAMPLDSADWQITNCIFTGNIAGEMSNGGATYGGNASFTGCQFADNAAFRGPVAYGLNLTFVNCFMNENSAGEGGGIIFVQDRVIVRNCEITNNSSQGIGGGIFMGFSSDQDSIIGGSLFSRNFSRSGSAAFFFEATVRIDSCIFDSNEATILNPQDPLEGLGGGIAGTTSSNLLFNNCTFSENTADRSGGAAYIGQTNASFINCALENNTGIISGGGIEIGQSSAVSIRASEIVSNTSDTGGGILLDNSAMQIENSRVCGNVIGQINGGPYDDLGGNQISDDENCGCIVGDIDCNFIIDGSDLAVILGNWGSCTAGTCIADLDHNGIVNGADLSLILGTWGVYDG